MVIILTFEGHKTISWNKLYSQNHWIFRKKLADSIHQLVADKLFSLQIKPLKLKPVEITITSFSRRPIDPDNVCAKLYIDGIKEYGLIEDDTEKEVDSVRTRSMKWDSEVTIIEIKTVG